MYLVLGRSACESDQASWCRLVKGIDLMPKGTLDKTMADLLDSKTDEC